jgi:hypothetical protein
MSVKRGFRSGVCHAANVERVCVVKAAYKSLQSRCVENTQARTALRVPADDDLMKDGANQKTEMLEQDQDSEGDDTMTERVVTILNDKLSHVPMHCRQQSLHANEGSTHEQQLATPDLSGVENTAIKDCNLRPEARVCVSDAANIGSVLWGFRAQQLYPYVYADEIETVHIGCRYGASEGGEVRFFLLSMEQPGSKHLVQLPCDGDSVDVSHVCRGWKGFFLLAELVCTAAFNSSESATLFGIEGHMHAKADAAQTADLVVRIRLRMQAWARPVKLKHLHGEDNSTDACVESKHLPSVANEVPGTDWQRTVAKALSGLQALSARGKCLACYGSHARKSLALGKSLHHTCCLCVIVHQLGRMLFALLVSGHLLQKRSHLQDPCDQALKLELQAVIF